MAENNLNLKPEARKFRTSPAGMNDEITLVAMDINHIIENNKIKLKANPAPRVEMLSSDLDQGSTIKAYNGDVKLDINNSSALNNRNDEGIDKN